MPIAAAAYYADEFECAACGASGPTAIFEDIASGESVCVCCGTVHSQDVGILDCAEQTMADNHAYHPALSTHDPMMPVTAAAATTSPALTTTNSPPPDIVSAPLLPHEVISDVERELHAAANPTMNPTVTAEEKKAFGCGYRMFDKPFDIMAKRCDLMEGLFNRRSLVAMRSACERVAVRHPEFALTHDPGVQAVSAYVVATHPPGVDRGRTRLLKETDERCGLRGICTELNVTMSAVAKCVRNHGDRLYTAMKPARRLGILPELGEGPGPAGGGGVAGLIKKRPSRRSKRKRKSILL